MRRIIRVGKPTHLKYESKLPDGRVYGLGTRCGLVGTIYETARDPRDVDCLNCIRTHAYREAMNGTES